MTTAITEKEPALMPEVEMMGHTLRMVDWCVKTNTQGVTQEESLKAPQPAGNCLNWVLGHLVCVQNRAVQLVGREPVVDAEKLNRYDRGSAPIGEAADPLEISELLDIWDKAVKSFATGLEKITKEALALPAPFSPSNNPNETIGTLLNTILFHQSYHSGQLGVLRRVAGKEGAIK